MLVRVNIGRKAGQIQDIEISAAKRMLADGRATEVRYESEAGEPEGVAKLIAGDPAASDSPADITNDNAKSARQPRKK